MNSLLHAEPTAARRILSPLGKILKTQKMLRPKTYRQPDLRRVRSKYLSNAASSQSDLRRISHEKYASWRLGKLYSDVPDYKHSQPSTYDTGTCLGTRKSQDIVTLKQVGHATANAVVLTPVLGNLSETPDLCSEI